MNLPNQKQNKTVIIPTSQNFSDIQFGEDSYDMPSYEEDYSGIGIETTIISMLTDLTTDRERLILLTMMMGQDGYQFNHKDIAAMLQIDYSWYMRIVRGIKRKLSRYNEQKSKKSVISLTESINSKLKSTKNNKTL